jgi:hypothetical protein
MEPANQVFRLGRSKPKEAMHAFNRTCFVGHLFAIGLWNATGDQRQGRNRRRIGVIGGPPGMVVGGAMAPALGCSPDPIR